MIYLFVLLYLIFYLSTDFRLSSITMPVWIIIILFIFIISYLYTGLTNNDVLVANNSIEIVNRMPLFKKRISFQYDKIRLIKFRHEWTETFGESIKPLFLKYILTGWIAPFFFPTDYKWINVSADKDYIFYCFGIERDFFENEEPCFEDLFNELSKKGVNVRWTNNLDI